MTASWLVRVLAMLAIVLGAGSAAGQSDPEKQRLASKAAQESMEAFEKGDFAKAEGALRRQLVLQPDNFVVYYNLACCRAMLGDPAGAEGLLVDAVDHGFTDIRHLKSDPHLASVRDRPKVRALVENWTTILGARVDANLELNRKIFAKGYREWRDAPMRLAYMSAFDARSDETVKAELSRLMAWADGVMPGLADPKQVESDAWVIIVMPSRRDFEMWVTAEYGQGAVRGASMIAGSYEHDAKRLVSMDLGSTLRHEFLHVLHWRMMTRLGQSHPIWVMEGLCSLVEDYDVGPAGEIVIASSWRTNMVKRIERIGKLTPIEDLARMPQLRFTGARPLANYAMARAVFHYLWQKGRLKDWYAHYTAHYGEDPSGVASLEAVLEMDIAAINADFKAWARALPAVPEEIKPGMASLGVEVEAGNGDGPVVVGVPRRRDGARVELKQQDVITAIDGKPVREMAELVRVLGGYQPGATVEVSYRRFKLTGVTKITLIKK